MKKIKRKYSISLWVVLCIFLLVCQGGFDVNTDLDNLAIFVPQTANRPVSYTNKKNASYYTQTHQNNHPEYAWFTGWNIASKKVFDDYRISINNVPLVRPDAKVTVYPHKLVREWVALTETFWMFDNQNILCVEIDVHHKGKVTIDLLGESVEKVNIKDGITYYISHKLNEQLVATAPIEKNKGFFIFIGKNEKDIGHRLAKAYTQYKEWEISRIRRMEAATEDAYCETDNETLSHALCWLKLTTDQLITQHNGQGIYAGLPLLAEYWSRDELIALPGACLVLGQFKEVRSLLLSIANHQNTISDSKFYGKIPDRRGKNIPQQDLNYYAADATPRFIINIKDYVNYSGDTAIITQLYPAVKRSIKGAIQYRMDKKGYLTHSKGETWMSPRHSEDTITFYFPRTTRACEIQALWHKQLLAGISFAQYMNDSINALKWKKIAHQLKTNFMYDFFDNKHHYMADYLDKNGDANFTFRPNQLYAMDFIDDDIQKERLARLVWEKLVYAWGTSSLEQHHDFFYPYHVNDRSHTYHNGSVCLWLNGMAMQRLIEAGEIDMPFQLFMNMLQQLLERGGVGALAENSNTYPQPNKKQPLLTGNFLQAWSNAEHLRIWYQHFLGIQPQAMSDTLLLKARIPKEIKSMIYSFKFKNGAIHTQYHRISDQQIYEYTFQNINTHVSFDFTLFRPVTVTVEKGESIRIILKENSMSILQIRPNGVVKQKKYHKDKQLTLKKISSQHIMEGIHFCQPDTNRM